MSQQLLWIATHKLQLPWADAVKAGFAAAPSLNTAIVMGVGKGGCVFAALSDGELRAHPRAPLPATVFELKAFGGLAELRWVAQGQQVAGKAYQGKAILLIEAPEKPVLKDWTVAESGLEPLWSGVAGEPPNPAGQYLLWGTARSSAGGWTQLWEHRIGALWVPGQIEQGQRMAAKFVEYVGPMDPHGNVGIAAERWSDLVAVEVA